MPRTMSESRRQVELEGCHNFRDLGGYPTVDGRRVRWGEVYRSDGLQALTARDVKRMRSELRIAHVIDLRSSGELTADGRGLLADQPLTFHHLPLFDGEVRARRHWDGARLTLADSYFGLLQMAKSRVAQVVSTLAEASEPAVFHCAAGKDRTGVISAVLLGLLGVADELITADYALTREVLDSILERLSKLDGYRGMLEHLPPDTLHAEPDTMRGLLSRVRGRYGSMRGYAKEVGVSDRALARLERRLLEDG